MSTLAASGSSSTGPSTAQGTVSGRLPASPQEQLGAKAKPRDTSSTTAPRSSNSKINGSPRTSSTSLPRPSVSTMNSTREGESVAPGDGVAGHGGPSLLPVDQSNNPSANAAVPGPNPYQGFPDRPDSLGPPEEQDQTAINHSLSRRKYRRRRSRVQGQATSEQQDDEVFDPVAMRQAVADEADACRMAFQHIDLVVDGHKLHSEVEVSEALSEDIPKTRQFVWEVMYENQRGIYLLGKAHYSSNSLLPTDPTAFTLPITIAHAKPQRSSSDPASHGTSSSSQPRSHSQSHSQSHSHSHAASSHSADEAPQHSTPFLRKTIKTQYDLDSYQTPSPAWVWITPWMVNMRANADEQGWRYNLWFHRRGWRQHSGLLNWRGWVRRREWIRLRVYVGETAEGKLQEKIVFNDEVADKGGRYPRELVGYFEQGIKDPTEMMVQALVEFSLDREKLQRWTGWLEGADEEAKSKLAALLKDESNLKHLSKAFIFPTFRAAFFQTLTSRGLADKQACYNCME